MTSENRFARPAAELIQQDVERALAEDLGSGDATADLLPADASAEAVLVCREPAVLAGSAWFDACFRSLDAEVSIEWNAVDGDRVPADSTLCRLRGNARALVTAERSALNFLQLLSGTATVTAGFVAALAGSRTRLLDTRKTIPGLRLAQKYAVRCGGGVNHRIGLHDGILIKENHIIAAGSIALAVGNGRRIHPDLPLEVEVETLDELRQALDAGADRIMIDNFDPASMREAVRIANGRASLEVSGNVDLDRIGEIAASGVDFVSVGALTKHVRAVDLSLRLRLH
ncbi:carboxylating nicotinate-nucleotide diphosphorylase [Dyella sp.]|jgi:nicotinate-nucleotide pyrophosphorylase (carboxylating)|uniref:carboxylating nicotinate-nucleotide diphosphorylase n=1 Tax=Dyella sp. TaxID=1869338 RepID=UPI002D77A46A|nr:carboxylating nicotinate-nucleotide diphosphorylase [Dyella sp.]HET6432129.1 carboxylating nicotinate-nucleotide diphosphorylase [Dyella sp.]